MFSRNEIKLWFFPRNENNKNRLITKNEQQIAIKLNNRKAEEYIYSRGCVRHALSDLFGISPLKIPLDSPPGKPPILNGDFGSIAFSHCKDALLVGWSSKKIGVDIERSDRNFNAYDVSQRFFCEEEKKKLSLVPQEQYRLEVLKLWVLKEASIKWQNGSIALDLSNWQISRNYNEAYHRLLRLKINTLNFEYKSWNLAIAHNCKNVEIKEIVEKV